MLENGKLSNPEALNKVRLDFENSLGQEPCIALQINISLEPYEKKDIVLCFGNENSIEDVKNKYKNIQI